MDNHKRITWECPTCNDIIISDSRETHKIDECKCGKTSMDLEEYYSRTFGTPRILKIEMNKKDGKE